MASEPPAAAMPSAIPKADAAIATGDHEYLAREISHVVCAFRVSKVAVWAIVACADYGPILGAV